MTDRNSREKAQTSPAASKSGGRSASARANAAFSDPTVARTADPTRGRAPSDFVLVVAVTTTDEALMLRREGRGGADEAFMFPAGPLRQGEEPEEAAARKLREQTGFACRELVRLGSFAAGGPGGGEGHYFYGVEALRVRTATDERRKVRLVRRPFDQLPACVGFDGYHLLEHAAAIGLVCMHRTRYPRPLVMTESRPIG